MYCSDEREIAFNILSFSFKQVLEMISKSQHIRTLDFTHLSTAFIIATLVSIVIRFLLLICTKYLLRRLDLGHV